MPTELTLRHIRVAMATVTGDIIDAVGGYGGSLPEEDTSPKVLMPAMFGVASETFGLILEMEPVFDLDPRGSLALFLELLPGALDQLLVAAATVLAAVRANAQSNSYALELLDSLCP